MNAKGNILLVIFTAISLHAVAQMGIGIPVPHGSAGLDITDTKRGLLIPRVSLGSTGDNATLPGGLKTGMLVFNTNPSITQGQGTGFYYDSSTLSGTRKWVKWAEGTNTNEIWATNGNLGTNSNTHFLGTTDNNEFRLTIRGPINIGGTFIPQYEIGRAWINPNTRSAYLGFGLTGFNGTNTLGIGHFALDDLVTGNGIVAIGDSALANLGSASSTLYNGNIAIGFDAAAGSNNVENTTALGGSALIENQESGNTGIGFNAINRMSAPRNTAFGRDAMGAINIPSTGAWLLDNTAFGTQSLWALNRSTRSTAFGDSTLMLRNHIANTVFGFGAMYQAGPLIDGEDCSNSVAIGSRALFRIRFLDQNTAIGANALSNLLSAESNTAIGYEALRSNDDGEKNTAIGSGALANSTSVTNTAIGAASGVALTTGGGNTAIGYLAMAVTNTANTTAIGAATFPTASNQIRVGNASVSSIGGQVAWTSISNGTTKTDVKEDIPGMAFVKMLKPVTYYFNPEAMQKYNKELAPAVTLNSSIFSERHAGLIAQDVLSAAKGYSNNGLTDIISQPATKDGLHSINYELMVVPLIKTIQEQQATLASVKKLIEELEKQLKTVESTQ